MNIAEKALQLKQDIDDVYEAGRLSVWEGIQNGGRAANYYYAFAYNRFDDNNYNPPYVIKSTDTTTGSQAIFYANELITDTKVEIIAAKNANNCFYNMSNCHTIRKFTVNENTSFTNTFTGVTNLVNLEMSGTIGKSFDIHWSTKLSRASIESIVNALSASSSGLTLTLSETAVNNAFSEDEWNALVASKQNWTISLV